ncbi:uncharacterized protein LOC133817337 [Humulus lupulus]|uniref:uncharacterized protein LOC133817337 n=1 Tax=Humulus lupulus TaxID=3486 RepID=UPI002B407110|nr:uncharacterized protein LOC133817337 [Humulus lupulus]
MFRRTNSSGSSNSASAPPPLNWRSARESAVPSPNSNEANYGELLFPASRSFRSNPDFRGPMEAQRPFRRMSSSFGSTSVPSLHRSPVRLLILDNEPQIERVAPRYMQIPRESPPRPIESWHFPVHRTTEQQSRNSSQFQQQSKALENLRKEFYNPVSKRLTTKVNLYYRDTPVNPKDLESDEDGKRCAICLDDFERGQEVMLTPCKHMFHEDCIVPWAKSNGQCPVCRAVFGPKMRDSSLSTNNNSFLTPRMAGSGLSTQELVSIIRALGDSFQWGY